VAYFILYIPVGINYSVRDIIYDVINYCTSNFAMRKKLSIYDQIVITNLKRRRRYPPSSRFLREFSSEKWLTNRVI